MKKRALPLALTLALCLSLAVPALAADWDKVTEVKDYEALVAALQDEKVEEIKIVGQVTVPGQAALDADKPILIGKEGVFKLAPGAVVRSDVPQGKFWYEDSEKTWDYVAGNMETFLLFQSDSGNFRVMYGTQPDLDDVLEANASHGTLSTAVFSGADVTLSKSFEGATIQVMGGRNLTVEKDVAVKAAVLNVTGDLTVAEGAKLEIESGSVAGKAVFRDGETQKPEALEVAGEVEFPAAQVEPEEPAEPETPVNPFTDVAESSPFYKAILWAVEQKITSGKTATTFAPGESCTRAQIVTFLWRAAGSPEPKAAENQYEDVTDSGAYYYKAVQWAAEMDMEYSGTFDPGEPCSRSAAVYFIWKASGSPKAETKASFTDLPQTPADGSQYYWPDLLDAVNWAVEQGVTAGTGDGTTFSPDTACTRGQIVTFLHRNLVKD